MTETGKLILKLTVLTVPALILFCTLYPWQKEGSSIGGGGYDLSELVYSGCFTLFVVCWNVWVFVALLSAKTDAAKLNNKILLAIGVVVMVAVAVWFFRQLR
ncbi:hypothetical protein [Mucilaginibacter myungsuensis]|uniref:Uncharacterized protein n=1 Tax=Mucilaginibacter myungsuensis TaxID=649104 RepID=A0A929PW24_9SPHI|nr:hypothetical protein [Mucilaginibacter myungsuensis]MBE9661714.1 hypothetical protein [Mucilaginibacter myungsuensis]MDN3597857.1 hypothetical protein [Mucilaginibacter myungsuensis]